MDNHYQRYHQYTLSNSDTPATEQSKHMLQSFPYHHQQISFNTSFPNQFQPTQHHQHVDYQSQHVIQPFFPTRDSFTPDFWNPMSASAVPHHTNSFQPGYSPFGHPSSPSNHPSVPPNFFHYADFSQQQPPLANSNRTRNPSSPHHSAGTPTTNGTSAPASVKSSTLRGPPRKPRQSGHALWVGNLPFSTDITKLKEHFSTGATGTIESVFWIARSKSAFVSYRTSDALMDAMSRFHNSRFEGVLLVCRARRADIPIPIPNLSTLQLGNTDKRGPPLGFEGSVGIAGHEGSSLGSIDVGKIHLDPPIDNNAKKRFFIMKSLGEDDLQLSVRNGHWITQEHNEKSLNEAFTCAEDVYLIFSANRSGEYFGYARMQGLINILPAESRPKRPAEDALDAAESDMPEVVYTPGTESAPEGAIFTDAYRGTIFWEADMASQDNLSHKLVSDSSTHESTDGGASPESAKDKEWNLGSPFEIKWMSTTRLPFYRTRGLRNPWNSNRDVKIARDGTELETNIGIRMLELFHQIKTPVDWEPNGSPSMSSLIHSPV